MAEFDTPLVLTTPHEKGQRVKDAQFLLKGNNVFTGLAPFKDQVIDGDFGPITAQACARAKFWLGYPTTSCDPVFGQKLYEFLTGKTQLPVDYNSRRNQRLAAESFGSKALDLAKTQIGIKESPAGSNHQKYGVWYGFDHVPWCAIFESWCFYHSGYKRYRYAAVEYIFSDAIARRNNLRQIWSPKYGDIVCYSWSGDTYAHTAFFDSWIDQHAGTFWDVGGNTGPANFSNGGEVARMKRNTSYVHGFVRVG